MREMGSCLVKDATPHLLKGRGRMLYFSPN
ncbi:hypothetical protein PSEUDO8BK_10899 [Pseudomonas sp. 8BK]|nr:hypothetical protein PSEUDO8BK_10899 [Pseudomonas sp. 8BK]